MGKERWGGSTPRDTCRASLKLAPNRHPKFPVPLYIPYFFMPLPNYVCKVTVMSGQRRLVRDILPGSYPLAEVVEFSDLPPLLPIHTIVQGCYWIQATKDYYVQ